MSLKLEIQKKSLERSPRVKAIDFHNENPWVVYGLYSGTLALYDYNTNVSLMLSIDFDPHNRSLSVPDPSCAIRAAEAVGRMRV